MNQPKTGKFRSIIFLHTPKAAGSTLSSIIHKQFSAGSICSISKNGRFGILEEEFKALPSSEREKITCLEGHMSYGLHQYMAQPCGYVTLLRNPIERIISHYHYVLRTPHHYLHQYLIDGMSLSEYVKSGISPELNNGQTKIVAGIPWHDRPWEDVYTPPDMLQTAIENIRNHFIVIGLSERFDDSVLLMKKKLGWKNIFYQKQHVGRRKHQTEISESTLDIIKEKNKLDLELYCFAKERLEQDIALQGYSYRLETKFFQIFQIIYTYTGISMIKKRTKHLFIKLFRLFNET